MPWRRGSTSVACRNARAKDLKVASTMWWELWPASLRMCSVTPPTAQTQRNETPVQGIFQTRVGAGQHADTTEANHLYCSTIAMPAIGQQTCVGQRAEEVLHQLRVEGADALCGDVHIEAQERPPRQILQHNVASNVLSVQQQSAPRWLAMGTRNTGIAQAASRVALN
jgi:hypothetical protein